MTFTDSHCHLDHEKFSTDLPAVLNRASDTGVNLILCIGTGDGPPELDRAIRLAEAHPKQIVATVGVHPHEAAKVTPETYTDLRRLGQHPKVVAYGEIGLDFHYDFSPRPVQRDVFIEQLNIAHELDLPIIVHTREAWEETLAVLTAHWHNRDRGGIIHCFSGDATDARRVLDMNFHLAFGGVVTYKTADNVREALLVTPDDRLLIETDAPFLAPIPFRGKRNEPAMMMETLKKVAEVRQTTPEHIAKITADNFARLCLNRPLQSTNPTRYTGVSHGN